MLKVDDNDKAEVGEYDQAEGQSKPDGWKQPKVQKRRDCCDLDNPCAQTSSSSTMMTCAQSQIICPRKGSLAI